MWRSLWSVSAECIEVATGNKTQVSEAHSCACRFLTIYVLTVWSFNSSWLRLHLLLAAKLDFSESPKEQVFWPFHQLLFISCFRIIEHWWQLYCVLCTEFKLVKNTTEDHIFRVRVKVRVLNKFATIDHVDGVSPLLTNPNLRLSDRLPSCYNKVCVC